MVAIPPSWDGGLETLLQAPTYASADVRWSNKIVNIIGDTQTFSEAINRLVPCGNIQVATKKLVEDPSKMRENYIRKRIMTPLSPRKPVVIPCPCQAVKQRDRQKLEKILRQRSALSALSKGLPQEGPKENGQVARHVEFAKRTCSSLSKRRPTFYWGM
jgi:hypothetical protein